MSQLNNTHCNGSTALFDAIVLGVTQMITLKALLQKMTDVSKYRFLHVVLTDGQDNSSEIKLNDLGAIFLKMGMELGSYLKTYLIGINLDENASKDLQFISTLGQQSCELLNCNDSEIEQIFNRIIINFGINRQTHIISDGNTALYATKQEAVIDIDVEYFLVLFTLDKSASMSGQRWNNVTNAVNKVLNYLQSPDLVGVTTFNSKVDIIYGNGLQQ